MKPTIICLCASLAAMQLGAQPSTRQVAPAPADTINARADSTETESDESDDGAPQGLQFGVASGALRYPGGRAEQSFGGVVRFAPARWFAVAVTPTMSRVKIPASRTTAAFSQSGMVDLPIEAMLSHAFHGPFTPTVAAGFGVTLPVGDTATGFGAGKAGYSTSASLGLAPTEQMWVHLGAGRSLGGLSMQSALTGADGWGDMSVGYSVTSRLSLSGGYSTDLGSVDPTIGRSTSLNGGFAVAVRGLMTVNVATSHGMSGAAPTWSVALGIGTAFPYLRRLGTSSPTTLLRNTFGAGPHGLGGTGGTGIPSGRGHR